MNLSILTRAVSFKPLPERSCTISPSRKPASTKSVTSAVIVLEVIVKSSIKAKFSAEPATDKDILLARASVVSAISPTRKILFAI